MTQIKRAADWLMLLMVIIGVDTAEGVAHFIFWLTLYFIALGGLIGAQKHDNRR